ncbi:DNA damage-induced apoptosis suppressor protein Nitric oxide-inducible gene protein [Larimichthys crocea]|uniref:DNA damage-induced apoptosis suppressor protein Nitric oxide-inducible gene protein n=1 Tax=Larimichthys crocea TaxID=215358 RepID=A0A6G0J1B0_LARCR|nr:DNA damage-induced apoptosis suppressor protein Nitric oxide-inducible gene protein [Larimichthys crocea]
MSVRRALVDCVVLSLQGDCVFYPCCEGCFSRIDVEQQDTTRCRCSKCGYSCPRGQLEYRYRLSMRVSRDASIFGVTVFGTCLNSFFGIHASGLQRLVETPDGPVGASTKATLLRKAVEDCFIGRRFIFGLKVTKTDSGPLFGGPVANDSSSKDAVHFIASQMILPKAAGLEGCTVVSYYRILLQKAADFELGSTDPSKTSRPPATDLLLIPCNSPGRSFNNISLCADGFLSRSLQRSQYQDCTLTPTPPWQKSLGLVTSSAEQEEGCSTQDSGDENNTQTDNFRTPRHAQKGRLEDHKVTEETVLSPLLSLECRSYSNPSFSRYPHSPIEKAVGNTPILNTCFSPSPPGHNISRRFSPRQLTETFLPSSLAWDDLPFSESLTEFLCEENRNFEPHLNVQIQKETTRNNLKMRSQDKDLSIESTSDCRSNTQIKDGESQILLDITNTPALNDRQDLSEQPCKNPAECKNKSQDRYLCSLKCHQENNKAIFLPFENEEEQLEEDTYNCSADLFGSSFMIDMNPNTPTMHAETIRTITGARPVLSKPDRCHLRSEKAYDPNSTPDKQKQKSNKCIHRDSLILPGTQDLDFIPPSQSTPIVKLAVVPGSPTSSYRTLTSGDPISQPDSQESCASKHLSELDNKKPVPNRLFSLHIKLCRCSPVGPVWQRVHKRKLIVECDIQQTQPQIYPQKKILETRQA